MIFPKLSYQIRAYAIAILSVLIAIILTVIYNNYSGQNFSIVAFFYLAVYVSTRYGGRYPGLTTTVLSILSIGNIFLLSFSEGIPSIQDTVRLCSYAMVMLLINWLTADADYRRKLEKRNHIHIRQSEALLSQALQAANMGVWDYDLSSQELIWSPEHEKLFGLAPGEFDGHYETFESFIHPDDRHKIRESIQQAIAQRGELICLFRIIGEDGTIHWIESRGQVFSNEKNEPQNIRGTVINLDQRILQEESLKSLNQDMELTIQERTTALQESEARYRAIVEDQTELIVRFLPDTTIVFVNEAYCRYFDISPEEVLGKSYAPIIFPDDLDYVNKQVELISVDNPIVDITNRVIVNGELRWTQWNNRLLCDENGNVSELQSVGRDITSWKKVEEALQINEERLKLALEGSGDGLWDWNVVTGEVYVNSNWVQMLGYAQDELSVDDASAWTELIHPEDLPWVTELLDAHLKDSNQPYCYDYRLRSKSGEWKWVTNYGKVVARAADGQPLRMVGTHKDIGDRKETELRLQETSQRLALATNSASIGIWDYDIVNNVLIWDEQMSRLYGIPLGEFGGAYEAWQQGVHPEDRQAADLAIHKAIAGTEDFHNIFRVIWKNGEIHHIEAHAMVLRDETGNAQRMIGVNWDISDRKKAEEQLKLSAERISLANAELSRAARLKDEFLAGMSHELRTPLNAVLGMSEVLLEEIYGNLTDRQKQSVSLIERSGRHLLTLINDILDLSKIEAGKMSLEINAVQVRQLCKASLSLVKELAQTKGIEINCNIDPSIGKIELDERRIRQVLINLLSNAIKFTNEGGKVDLSVRCPDAGKIEFSVSDTGIGIAADQMGRLFQPFTQLDNSLSRRYAGTGLGLSLVRRIVELHGGSVSLESEVNKGSCFTVSLPYRETEVSSQPVTIASSSVSTHPTSIQRAFVIEDSESSAAQISRYLAEIGATAIIYPMGQGVIEAVLQAQPDVIILDILLPDLPGWNVLVELKTNPQTSSIPVVIVSVVDDRPKGFALGSSDYLVKPINRSQLQESLNRIMGIIEQPPVKALVVAHRTRSEVPLIVMAEDNEGNILTMLSYLEAYGLRIIVARNGLEAIDLIKQCQPDLVLMDIQMPELDGLEAIRQVRTDVRFANLPIIALTALAMPGDRERCLEAGANEYLSKPVRLLDVKLTIQKYLPDWSI